MVTQEAARLESLHRYRILDTKPEQAFDDLTLLASQIFKAPIALITLIDEDRQWFKSRIGVVADRDAPQHRLLRPRHSTARICSSSATRVRTRGSEKIRSCWTIRTSASMLGAPLITPDGHALGNDLRHRSRAARPETRRGPGARGVAAANPGTARACAGISSSWRGPCPNVTEPKRSKQPS